MADENWNAFIELTTSAAFSYVPDAEMRRDVGKVLDKITSDHELHELEECREALRGGDANAVQHAVVEAASLLAFQYVGDLDSARFLLHHAIQHTPDGMITVTAPATYAGLAPAVFLLGGITGCRDWQAEAVTLLRGSGLVVINPRQPNYPADDEHAHARQVAWENVHLYPAAWPPMRLVYFPEAISDQPIAWYELGASRHGIAPTAIGSDPDFHRRRDLIEQTRYWPVPPVVHDNLPDAVEALKLLNPVAE